MALEKEIKLSGNSFIKTEFGNIKKDNIEVILLTYISIVVANIEKDELMVTVRFASSELTYIKTYACKYKLDGENPIKQAYEYLKTLDEFKDAKDV